MLIGWILENESELCRKNKNKLQLLLKACFAISIFIGNLATHWHSQSAFVFSPGELQNTLPKTNIAPENTPSQKETIVFQPSIFRGYVSFREGTIRFFAAAPACFDPGTISCSRNAPTFVNGYSVAAGEVTWQTRGGSGANHWYHRNQTTQVINESKAVKTLFQPKKYRNCPTTGL